MIEEVREPGRGDGRSATGADQVATDPAGTMPDLSANLRVDDRTSLAAAPVPAALTMLGSTDSGACTDGSCAVPDLLPPT